jgi:hypothetical protein
VRKRIQQGTSRVVSARDIVDDNDAPLVVEGWHVHGVARANHSEGALLAEWSDTPTGGQGRATAAGRTVSLFITPEMSSAWVCDRVAIQAKIINPGDPDDQTERIIDETYDFDLEAVFT